MPAHRIRLARVALSILVCGVSFHAAAWAQPLAKSAVQVDAGSTKLTGQTFGYRLTYNCSSTSGPCLAAQVVDLLPIEVQEVSTVPASPTGDVAAINVTPNFGGSGRTRVQFVMISPLPAGNSGDLLVNVRFPNGSTPNGTVATNTADGINLGATPGTFTTPPVNVTAVASAQVTLSKVLTTAPANLDLPESYRLRISVPNSSGALNLTAIGPVTDTLPPGTVFNGATPAADCQPGCVGTTPATVTWTSPCTLPLQPNQNCDIQVNVTFPSATFPSGTNVTNSFTATGTPLGQPSQNLGIGTITHPVTTFVPAPGAGLAKGIAGGNPNPPTLNQTFAYDLAISNSGNVPLDNMVVNDTLPVEMLLASVTTGSYSGAADFAPGVGVRVSYEKNTAPAVFTLWGSSPNTATTTTLTSPPPGLGAGEYVTRIRWQFGQAQPGMAANARPVLTGQIVNPDNAGGPVAIGDTITNCSDLSAVYTPGPTNVTRNNCSPFTLSGPFAQLNPAKDNLSGGGPFNPGQTVSWRLRVRSAPQSSSPVPLDTLEATDLLPVDLNFSTWTFDDQATGLPAPQVFNQIPNFAGTGRTLLRWEWNAGSGNLGVNQQVWINLTTSIRSGADFGSLANDFNLEHDAPGLGQRCSGGSTTDALDLDGDSDTAETLCRSTGTITVAPIAQLVSSKAIQAVCDGAPTSTSSGTLDGGALEYRLRVQNVGTVPMQNFVLIDILPFVGDTGVRDANPRGSQWMPILSAPITPPPGTVISYSTSGNPCRGEVGGPTTSCDPPNWTTVPPTPVSSTRSFKVEFGDRVVGPFDFVEFFFSMSTPAGVAPGTVAYNSFAYQADRGDGLGSLAAEPQKVGVAPGSCAAAGLGDFVWVDVDGDGTQNDGPTGLNDVYVRLLAPGTDGIAGSFDDVPLGSTLTSTGPGGAPGWYFFPGLAPGSYFVCIAPPPTFVLTTANQGSDTTDSDGNPATACSPLVTLTANELDPDTDFGLVATELAALGNYVWFDRNGDGVQNEAVTDGANGVTVRLHVDDGDATPEVASDPVIATTVTADDIYGQPGYYRFDGLTPGLPYFVEFVRPAAATAFTTPNAGADDTVDSDAALADGATAIVTLAPSEFNPTLDAGLVAPAGTLALGDQVWFETDNDGVYEPQSGELGVDDVRLDLYRDANSDGQPTLDEYSGSTVTATDSGFAGRYRFDDLAAGNYIVVVSPSAFAGGGALAGRGSATGNDPAPDPDDDVNGDDNGAAAGALVASRPVTLSDNGEPTNEDGDNDTNLTVDFGFIPAAAAPQPVYDYGDAPDVGAGTVTGNYNTTALDAGPFHLLGVQAAPFLGACVDADSGLVAGDPANGDDVAASAFVVGACASGANGDDEDGVTFSGPFVPGAIANFSVTAGGPSPCTLQAWVDWNRNGVFGDSAGEQIAANAVVPPGPPTVLSPSVPAGAMPGLTYARFRCSSASNVPPTGSAPDGEVEDYLVGVVGSDFGDAPASYATQGAGAASHTVNPNVGLRLGTCVDTEADGQPTAGAAGDDTTAGTSRVGSCFDDEDGVTFTAAIIACQSSAILVVASGAGELDAWFDWNGDGDFADAGEHEISAQTVTPGVNNLAISVPCAAVDGLTYARFRLSSAGIATPNGAAADGEVEDYAVNIGTVDLGDAPDSYGTLVASNGPNHGVTSGFSLGATVDTESDGQPSVGATGDGADEDGVTIPAQLVACSSVNLNVTLTNTAAIATPRLDAWIDFDGDGAFDDPRDRIATSLALVSGANALPVNVPCDSHSALTYGRFRLSSAGTATPLGPALDGEVEDWAVTVVGLDFGDAPDPTYPTLLASNGARHLVLPVGNPTLGSLVDTEPDGQPSATLNSDDVNGSDDEDGVSFQAPLIPGTGGLVTFQSSTGGIVSCWIDFNRDGDWSDAGEAVVANANVPAGPGVLLIVPFAVPVGSAQGQTASRCRISSSGGLGVTGQASDGEVEDHPVTIGVELPQIGVAKRLVSADRDSTEPTKFHVLFEIRAENLGNVALSGVQIVENLAATFADAGSFAVESVASGDLTVNGSFDGSGDPSLLAAGNTLAVGASGTVTVQIFLDPAGHAGPYSNTAVASGTSPGSVEVDDSSQDGTETDPDGNGDPTDNDDPTIFTVGVSVIEIPALDTIGLAIFALLLAGAGLRWVQRSRRSSQEV
ncbi:MAG: GEVED domain-containing protein [Thermoanaerobaculia bacterium]